MRKPYDGLLKQLDLDTLPKQQQDEMLAHIYKTIESRVGMRVVQGLNKEQLAEFNAILPESKDSAAVRKQKDEQAVRWLEKHVANIKEIESEEISNLMSEIKGSTASILKATRKQSS